MATPPKIWLSSPHMGGTELQFIKEAFDTNWIAPLGPHVNGFEADLQHFTGVAHAAALSSGTAALHLALILLGVRTGDEVICQSMTFSSSANAIIYQGATPVFVDSEPETWNMSPSLLEQAITERIKNGKKPKAIIPVHLYGMPAKMNEINLIAKEYGIPVVEDAAETLGEQINGRLSGSLGLFGVLSFNGNKIITTSGGGALLSDDGEQIQKARFLATQSRDNAPHFQHSQIGYNYRMSNVLAAIGRGQMQVLKDRIAARRANFERYKKWFGQLTENGFHFEFQCEPQGYFSNRWITCIIINPEKNKGITRETVRLSLEAQNIESRPLWKPMHRQPVFAGSPFFGNGISDQLFENGLCLPSGSNLSGEEQARIFSVLKKIFRKK